MGGRVECALWGGGEWEKKETEWVEQETAITKSLLKKYGKLIL